MNVGYYAYNEIKGGFDGLNFYRNTGDNKWAVEVEDMQFNHKKLGTEGKSKAGIIDSSNSTI